MLERNKPFEQLGIDFEEQERRKEAEYAKLDRIVRYATTSGCRQLEILDYFEDPNRHTCGTCDNCKASRVGQGSAASDGPPDSVACVKTSPADETHHARPPDVLNAIRIVLSGVARMKGRFGKQMVARMLVGSKAKEVSKYKLN